MQEALYLSECPVYACCEVTSPKPTERRSKLEDDYLLGKADGQDAWVVSDGEKIMLTGSVRRVDRPWTRFLAYYMGFSSASWEFQTNFGGRIVPTKRAIGAQTLRNGPLPPLETFTYRYRDLEAEEVENYARNYERTRRSCRRIW